VLIVDDLLCWWPLKGVLWLTSQLKDVAEKAATDEQPVLQAILENEVALEDGRVDEATYAERQQALMGELRRIRELRQRLAAEAAAAAAAAAGGGPGAPVPAPGQPISGKAKLEVDVDFEGYGKGA